MDQQSSRKLTEFVKKNTDAILDDWTERLLVDPTTSSYTKMQIDYVVDKARHVLIDLENWVGRDVPKEEVGRNYAEEGIKLFRMEIPLCEAVRAMVVLRRLLINFVENESFFDPSIEMGQMRELSERLVLFFDRAQYYLIRGYMEEMNKKVKSLWRLGEDETEKIFFEKSFYNR